MVKTLLVLAAGMGSRYGGLKQLDPVGPSGETILDYSVFDALRSGFDRVVFVIRRAFEPEFRSIIGRRYEDRVDVAYVFQEMDAVPKGFAAPTRRTKPWGTGHAIWCARDQVSGPFGAINADDFYGAGAFRSLLKFFDQTQDTVGPHAFAMVGYRLGKTLSEHGSVARGVCAVDEEGFLQSVTECVGIEKTAAGARLAGPPGQGMSFRGDEIVSMNFWGFTPAVFPLLEAGLKSFLATRSTEEKAEFYIPSAVAAMINSREARVRVLASEDSWFGVTYREDAEQVRRSISHLVTTGAYPRSLVSKNFAK